MANQNQEGGDGRHVPLSAFPDDGPGVLVGTSNGDLESVPASELGTQDFVDVEGGKQYTAFDSTITLLDDGGVVVESANGSVFTVSSQTLFDSTDLVVTGGKIEFTVDGEDFPRFRVSEDGLEVGDGTQAPEPLATGGGGSSFATFSTDGDTIAFTGSDVPIDLQSLLQAETPVDWLDFDNATTLRLAAGVYEIGLTFHASLDSDPGISTYVPLLKVTGEADGQIQGIPSWGITGWTPTDYTGDIETNGLVYLAAFDEDTTFGLSLSSDGNGNYNDLQLFLTIARVGDLADAAPPTSEPATPRFFANPSFEALDRYNLAGDGNGTVDVTTSGLSVKSPTGGGSYEGITVINGDVLGSLGGPVANPEIQFLGRINNVDTVDEWEGLIGWGAMNDSSLGYAFGLHFKAVDSVLTISAVISDGGDIGDADFLEIWQDDPASAPWQNIRITYADGVTTVALNGTVLGTIEKVISPSSTIGNFNVWMKNIDTANNAELQVHQLSVSWDS